jgi:5'-nucleotidase
MDNKLDDFNARLAGTARILRRRCRGREDALPCSFAPMPPVPDALEAFAELSSMLDTFILSTASFGNPSARQFRMGWANGHLGMQPQRVLMGPSVRLQVVEAGYPAQLTT